MTDSSWRQLQWADARDGWGTPGTTADGTRDTYLITEIDGHIVLARWTRRDGPPAPAWWTAREALTTALTIPSTPATETHAAQLAEAYENGTSLTSRAWHHPGTQALPIRDAINAAYAGRGQQDPPAPPGKTATAALARLAAQGRHDSARDNLATHLLSRRQGRCLDSIQCRIDRAEVGEPQRLIRMVLLVGA